MTASALRAIERFLLPNQCIACERMVEPNDPDALICRVCVTRMRGINPGCTRCAQPLPPVGPCRFCAEWTPQLEQVSSAVWLGAEGRALVHFLKYRGCTSLASVAAGTIVDRLPRPEGSCLVPVPLGVRRRGRRGYNQAAEIAESLGTAWQLPVRTDVLVRNRETRSQTALTPDARLANVARAFTAVAGQRAARAILVDDVLTTGATLDAAASALGSAGWQGTRAVTFARALTVEAKLVGT